MKCKTVICADRAEEVHIYAHERTRLVEAIERLVLDDAFELVGYKEREAKSLELTEISCFIVENNKMIALIGEERWQLKCRLYQLEEQLPSSFLKINQSCIANIRQIERFHASVSGVLQVIFKNGYTDYVSRRQVRHVKERLGLS